MAKFRASTGDVNAAQWTDKGVAEKPAPNWCGKIANKGPVPGGVMNISGEIHCFLPDGTVAIAKPGDWIVLDGADNVYPLPNAVFRLIYGEPHA